MSGNDFDGRYFRNLKDAPEEVRSELRKIIEDVSASLQRTRDNHDRNCGEVTTPKLSEIVEMAVAAGVLVERRRKSAGLPQFATMFSETACAVPEQILRRYIDGGLNNLPSDSYQSKLFEAAG